jgi:hypothetical protein
MAVWVLQIYQVVDKQISQATTIILDLWQFRKDVKIKPKVAAAESFDALMRFFYEKMLL